MYVAIPNVLLATYVHYALEVIVMIMYVPHVHRYILCLQI